jgi:hypothetical protein
MPGRFRKSVFAVAVLAATPVALWWSLLHIAAAIGLMVFAAFLWLATLPLHQDMRDARAKCSPRRRRRLELADAHVDTEFQRIIAGGPAFEG